jgi:hypothetical protein
VDLQEACLALIQLFLLAVAVVEMVQAVENLAVSVADLVAVAVEPLVKTDGEVVAVEPLVKVLTVVAVRLISQVVAVAVELDLQVEQIIPLELS